MSIKVYFKRNEELKRAKLFNKKDDFVNKLRAMVYIIDAKRYFKENNYNNISIIVNDEYLQNIANASIQKG